MGTLRPWKDAYQLLCSIDSVSGEMKSISPFVVPKNLILDDHTSTSIDSHYKVIESINVSNNITKRYRALCCRSCAISTTLYTSCFQDYEESKSFRAKLCGNCSVLWRVEGSQSALDTAKVALMDSKCRI